MFNLEVKRISLSSLVLSAYPFVVFIFALLSSFFGLGDLIDPEAGFFKGLMQVLLYSTITTGVIVLFSMLACFIYNILTSFGMRGFRLSLTEVIEDGKEEPSQTKEPVQEDNK